MKEQPKADWKTVTSEKAVGWLKFMDLLQRVHRDIADGDEVHAQQPGDTVSIPQAIKILGKSRRTIYAMLDDGRLASTGTGRARRIDMDSLAIQKAISNP